MITLHESSQFLFVHITAETSTKQFELHSAQEQKSKHKPTISIYERLTRPLAEIRIGPVHP